MINNEHIPVPGERYRHFKGGLYQIVALAKHSETMEDLVVYQALYGDYLCYARPLSMFMGVNDDGEPRFTLENCITHAESACMSERVGQNASSNKPDGSNEPTDSNELLFKILDCNKSGDKLDLMRRYRKDMDKRTLENIAISLDVVTDSENFDEIFEQIAQYLETRARFETDRLR